MPQFTIKDFALLSSFPMLMSVGQLLFRKCAMAGRSDGFIQLVFSLAKNPVFVAAVALYGIATLLWIWLLSRYTLALAYPFAATAIVMVPLLEYFFYRQSLPLLYWLGLLLIIAGVCTIVRAQTSS